MNVNFNRQIWEKPGVAKIAKKVAKGALIVGLAVGGADVAGRVWASLDAGIKTGQPMVDNYRSYRDEKIIQSPPLVVQAYEQIESEVSDGIERRKKLQEYGINPNQYVGKKVEAEKAIDSAETMQYCLEHGVKPNSNIDAHYLSDSLRACDFGRIPYGRNDDPRIVAISQALIALDEIEQTLQGSKSALEKECIDAVQNMQ